MDSVLLIVALGAVAAGFVQGLSGFGFGMVAMSFWAWVLEPSVAAALGVFGGLTGQGLSAFTVRRKFDLRLLAPFLAGGLVGIPVGIVLLRYLNADVFKAVLGALLAVWGPFMLFAGRFPPIAWGGRFADGVAGLLGGVFGGLGGFTGAVPTLWCTLRRMDKDEQRSVIQNFNLTTLAVIMASYVGMGKVTLSMLPLFGIVALALIIPGLLGARLYIGISPLTFRRIVLSLLTLSGVALLASSVPQLV